MPGSKLSKGDIFDQSFFKGLEDADKQLKQLLTTFTKMAKEAKSVSKGVSAAKSFNEVSKAAKKASESTSQLTASQKKLIAAHKRLKFAQSDEGKRYAVLAEKTRQMTAANKKLAQSQTGMVKSTNTWGNTLKSFQLKFNAMGNIIANFSQVALRQLKRAFVSTFNIVADFDKAMADVKSITKASKADMDALTKSAMKLGGSTKFTASEVAGLQKEYAKLGLTTTQILNAQAATLDLAAATSTELPRAAEVVGITLKQFGLDAKEATRVTDVMAESFTSSALDMEKFAEAMKFVGPAAKASGISIERTTAMLGQLADAGISGSMAGTSLRQIMLALSKESGTFAEKLERAAASGLDLAGASEEVQKRAATSLLVLADGIGTIDEYTESLENAAGASQAMADIQLDTLEGKITLVKSAWEGMILAMLNTEENLSGVKWAIQGIVDLLNIMATKADADALSSEKHSKRAVRVRFAEASMINKLANEATKYAETLQKGRKYEKEFFEMFDGFGKELKEFGIDVFHEMFPKPEKVKAELEDISEQLKAVKQDQIKGFEDEDQEYIEAHAAAWDTIEKSTEGVFSNLEGMVQQQHDDRMQKIADEREAEDKALGERIKAEETLKNIKADIANEGFNLVAALISRKEAKIDQQLAAEVISEEEAEKQKAKIRKQAAVVDKAQALFNIGINTAMGVTSAAAKVATIPLIPWITALGIAQAATVIATPIPAFAKGTDSAPGGIAVAGEKGSELMIGPDGQIGLTPDSATLMDIDKGTKIFPADITKEILRYSAIATGLGRKANDTELIVSMMRRIDDSSERLRRELKNKPVQSSTLTPAGILTSTYKGNTVIKKLDKYFG